MAEFIDADGVVRNLFQIGAAGSERTLHAEVGDPNDFTFPADFIPKLGDVFVGDTELWRYNGTSWAIVTGFPIKFVEHNITVGKNQQMTVHGVLEVCVESTLDVEGQVNLEL